MTDSDIIKTLKSIANQKIEDCSRDCAFYNGKAHFCADTVAKYSFALIKRQQAEIERLKAEKDNIIRNYKGARWRW